MTAAEYELFAAVIDARSRPVADESQRLADHDRRLRTIK